MKEYKTFFILMLCLSGFGMIYGTFYDFQIASYLFVEKNVLAIFLEAVGYYPLYIAVPVLCNLLGLKFNKKEAIFISWIISSISIALILVSSLIFLEKRNIYIINFKISICFAVFISVIIQYFLHKVIKKLHTDIRNRILIICLLGIVFIAWKGIIINGLKLIIGRARYCNIVHGVGYYTPWYVINRPSMGKSFPSGHTGGACGIMLILFVPLLFEKFRKYKISFEIFVLTYIFVVAFSRMILGKHMLSDVCTAIFIMTSGCLVLMNIYNRIKKYYDTYGLYCDLK